MKIGIDMMGGDFAPYETFLGIEQYLTTGKAHLVLVGNQEIIKKNLNQFPLPITSFTVIPSTEVIEMHEHPTKALKEKKNSSIAIGFRLLAEGNIDGFISAGNTGAMMVGSMYALKPIEGVLRPTISTLIPKESGQTGLLLDVGLNSDCKPEQLNQFAIMGSVYAQHILGIEKPRVALLNIGEEEGKGNLLTQAAYKLLKENKHIQFVGNAEGRDILKDKADVVVCDGFTGNVILKLAESLYEIAQQHQLNSLYYNRFNFENYGGTPVLGISKPVIIGHGISKAKAFKNMITLAEMMIEKDVMQKLQDELVN
ncbi:MAG: phosphate acyltransferase PlsX [Flavisolibacter sp.]